MEESRIRETRILLAGMISPLQDPLPGLLSRSTFQTERPDTLADSLELARKEHFDLIILGNLRGRDQLEESLNILRCEGSPSRSSSIVAMVPEDQVTFHREFLGKGLNEVISESTSLDKLERIIANLTHIAPRISSRILITLHVQMSYRKGVLFCQTVNLSRSGMLVRTPIYYPVGTRVDFQFRLPDSPIDIAGEAAVARHADSQREGLKGMGMIYEDLDPSTRSHFYQFLDRGYDQGKLARPS
ncbi:MAG TPA: PilZ domain-containing protein [Thermoanaerobaculia bacterium]|nr:PilZ domain-containing protein [Thermoanaerobaculia bacterium]HUM30328.1 PilZ domain-containing protein [Thermoanaerobaculia bacterium]HXK68521.1 PilZ domain-containing protein [Thermoanaerobaculia bacterium]